MKSVQELKELRERSLVKVALREKEEEYQRKWDLLGDTIK